MAPDISGDLIADELQVVWPAKGRMVASQLNAGFGGALGAAHGLPSRNGGKDLYLVLFQEKVITGQQLSVTNDYVGLRIEV